MYYFYIATFIFLLSFFLIEKYLRKGSKDMSSSMFDKNSTLYISIIMGIAFILIFISPVLNWFHIAEIPFIWIGIIGLFFGLCGIFIRCIAFFTLGKYFTRTLQKTEEHKLITNGIYQYIRHPGYLSDILIFIGIGMTVFNWITLIYLIITYPIVYAYRIIVEEKMLINIFGEDYIQYKKNTKRLIPFIF